MTNPSTETVAVPGAAVLSAWTTHDWRDEINLQHLAAFERIVVTTRNNTYVIVVTSPSTGEVLVRGGHFFPEFTAARLAGSSLGGSFLKLRSVNVGFQLEFTQEDADPVITTRVRTARVVPVTGTSDEAM